jgi:voltage-gated potassium channel
MPTLARSQDAYDRFSAVVELPLTILALLWLPVLVLPLVARLPAGIAGIFNAIDYLVWAVFVVEYLVRLYLAPSRWLFFTRHLVDLAVIALPALRPLRALRLLRLLNLARAGAVLAGALKRAREILTHRGLHFVLLAVLGLVLVCSAAELGFEQHARGATIHNFGDALWWATVTVTTVGYGDKYPVSPGGRGVAVVLMLVGIGLIGVLTATVASYFVEEKTDQEKTELNQRLDRIEAMLARALAPPHDPDPAITPDGKDPPPQHPAGDSATPSQHGTKTPNKPKEHPGLPDTTPDST